MNEYEKNMGLLMMHYDIVPFLTFKYLSDKQEQCKEIETFNKKYGFTFRDYELFSNIQEKYENDDEDYIPNTIGSINVLKNSSNKYIQEIYNNISEELFEKENLEIIFTYLSKTKKTMVEAYQELAPLANYNITGAVVRKIEPLFTKLTESKHTPKKIYNPCCGDASNILQLSKKAEEIELYDESECYYHALNNMILHDTPLEKVSIHNKDVNKEPLDDIKYDTIIAAPYTNEKIYRHKTKQNKHYRIAEKYPEINPKNLEVEEMYVLDMYYHLEENGIMILLFPGGILTNYKSKELRQYLIKDQNSIDAIIQIPAGKAPLVGNHKLAFTMLIISKNKENNDILLIDPDEFNEKEINKIINTYTKRKEIPKYSKKLQLEEIKANNYNLNPKRYLYKLEYEPKNLKEILKEQEKTNQKIYELNKEIKELLNNV